MAGYKVPDWKNTDDNTVFDVTVGKKVYRLPRLEYLTGAQAELMAKSDEHEGGIKGVLDVLSPGLGSAWRDVPSKFFNEFLESWHADSAVDLGESEASSGS